mmetsp:Transcript_53259/g.105872  ORF Transcript_53259/g.105872 Transcript_53259/m.105872 type:complete len:222 (+) Transcript_53259:879-1544(+)
MIPQIKSSPDTASLNAITIVKSGLKKRSSRKTRANRTIRTLLINPNIRKRPLSSIKFITHVSTIDKTTKTRSSQFHAEQSHLHLSKYMRTNTSAAKIMIMMLSTMIQKMRSLAGLLVLVKSVSRPKKTMLTATTPEIALLSCSSCLCGLTKGRPSMRSLDLKRHISLLWLLCTKSVAGAIGFWCTNGSSNDIGLTVRVFLFFLVSLFEDSRRMLADLLITK